MGVRAGVTNVEEHGFSEDGRGMTSMLSCEQASALVWTQSSGALPANSVRVVAEQ